MAESEEELKSLLRRVNEENEKADVKLTFIHWNESATGVHVFSILNPLPHPCPSHPLGSSQCTSPEHPVSCIKPGLAIYFTYDNMHVSVLSNHPTMAFSLRIQTSVLYICIYFAVSHIWSSLLSFLIPYICVIILYWCFSFWLTSLYNRLQFHPPH